MKLTRLVHRFYSKTNREAINKLLNSTYQPDMLEVTDESAAHMEANDSHFRVFIVSDGFENKSHLKRHREIMDKLKEEGIMQRIHAVSITAKTIGEYEKLVNNN